MEKSHPTRLGLDELGIQVKYIFVETKKFMSLRDEYFTDDEDFRHFQEDLAQKPDRWPPIPGCDGLRKARWGDKRRGKGKRGGCRVLYLHTASTADKTRGCIFLVHVYGKNQKDDISPQDKKVLLRLAERLKEESQKFLDRE